MVLWFQQVRFSHVVLGKEMVALMVDCRCLVEVLGEDLVGGLPHKKLITHPGFTDKVGGNISLLREAVVVERPMVWQELTFPDSCQLHR